MNAFREAAGGVHRGGGATRGESAIAMIAGGNHTLMNAFARSASPMLTSLGTFLFSHKKVPLRRMPPYEFAQRSAYLQTFTAGPSRRLVPTFSNEGYSSNYNLPL